MTPFTGAIVPESPLALRAIVPESQIALRASMTTFGQ
jgi:hypothetical protein